MHQLSRSVAIEAFVFQLQNRKCPYRNKLTCMSTTPVANISRLKKLKNKTETSENTNDSVLMFSNKTNKVIFLVKLFLMKGTMPTSSNMRRRYIPHDLAPAKVCNVSFFPNRAKFLKVLGHKL